MNNYRTKTKIIQNKESSSQSFGALISKLEDKLISELGDEYECIEDESKVINISIQAQPGLKFYINNNNNPIIIGSNGIFFWEIKRPNTYIYSLKIQKEEGSWPQINAKTNIIITYEYIVE